MRVLLVAVLAVACGGESGVLFDDARERSGGGAGSGASETRGGSTAAGGRSDSGPAGSPSEEAGADGSPVTSGGSGGGSGGSMAGQGGSGGSMVEPVGGKPAAGGSAGGGGSSSSGAPPMAGAGGEKPEDPEVPAACDLCRSNTMAFCEVSSAHPEGACIGCPEFGPDANLYRDCDGPGPEHYVSKNDHDPGYGCETFVGFMGSCP